MLPHWTITEYGIRLVEQFRNPDTSTMLKILTFMKTFFIVGILFPFAIAGLGVGQAFHYLAYTQSNTSYLYQKNIEQLRLETHFTVYQGNCCLTDGGFALIFGGLSLPNRERAGLLIKKIQKHQPTLVALQEVSSLREALYLSKELKRLGYGEFYFHMGAMPSILANTSGLFIASKVAIENPKFQSYSKIKIAGLEKWVNKGYFSFTIPNVSNFITTHLSPSENDYNPYPERILTRKQELEVLWQEAVRLHEVNGFAVHILGDFNIARGGKEYSSAPFFQKSRDVYIEGFTCQTDSLLKKNWQHKKGALPGLIVDYFLTFFGNSISTDKVPAIEEGISDHQHLISQV